MRRTICAAGAVLTAACLGWAGSRLIQMSKCWGSTASERVRQLPGNELLSQGSITTYAITIAAPPHQVWPWLVQIGRGRGGFYTYTAIERLLGADIVNLDRIDPALQTLKPDDQIWMTPERYLGRLPGQFWSVREVLPGRAVVLKRKPPRESTARRLVIGVRTISRRHDPATRPAPQRAAAPADWLAVGSILASWHLCDGAWDAARHQGAVRACTSRTGLTPSAHWTRSACRRANRAAAAPSTTA